MHMINWFVIHVPGAKGDDFTHLTKTQMSDKKTELENVPWEGWERWEKKKKCRCYVLQGLKESPQELVWVRIGCWDVKGRQITGPDHLTVQKPGRYEVLKSPAQSHCALPLVVAAQDVAVHWEGICRDNWGRRWGCHSTLTLLRPGCGTSCWWWCWFEKFSSKPLFVQLSLDFSAQRALKSSRPKQKLRNVSWTLNISLILFFFFLPVVLLKNMCVVPACRQVHN